MQSRTMSLLEAVTNVIVGFGLAVLTQMLVFPAFGLIVAFDQHVSIAVIFTMLSLGRGYILRRLFEGLASRPRARHTLNHGGPSANQASNT